MRTFRSLGLLLLFVTAPLFSQGSLIPLVPDQVIRLLGATEGEHKLREIRAIPGGFWLLLQSPTGYSIRRVTESGALAAQVNMRSGDRAVGLAVAKQGVASIVYRDRQPTLVQYDRQARLLSEIPLSCSYGENLLTVDGNVGVTCPNGLISCFSPKQVVSSINSWARPGSLSEILGKSQLAIVDQASGQLLWNDLAIGTLAASPILESPEIREARRNNQIAEDSLASVSSSAPGAAVRQKQILIMDTATDSTSLYLMIYPYSMHRGFTIVKVGADGSIQVRYQCSIPGGANMVFHKIEVSGGYLYIAGTSGSIYRYKI